MFSSYGILVQFNFVVSRFAASLSGLFCHFSFHEIKYGMPCTLHTFKNVANRFCLSWLLLHKCKSIVSYDEICILYACLFPHDIRIELLNFFKNQRIKFCFHEQRPVFSLFISIVTINFRILILFFMSY